MTAAENDRHDRFLRLYVEHEEALRECVRPLVPTRQMASEVMQEVSPTAWRKFPTLMDYVQFPRRVCLIAPHEILIARCRHARGRLVLDEDIVANLAEEGMMSNLPRMLPASPIVHLSK